MGDLMIWRRLAPRRLVFLFAVPVIIVGSTVPAFASAATTAPSSLPPQSEPPSQPNVSHFSPAATTQSATPNAVDPGMDCVLTSEQPYLRYPDVIANAAIGCSYTFPEMQVTESITRDRWYGTQTLVQPETSTDYFYAEVFIGLAWDCAGSGIYTYRNPTKGAVENWDGTWWYASNSNYDRISC